MADDAPTDPTQPVADQSEGLAGMRVNDILAALQNGVTAINNLTTAIAEILPSF